MRYRHLILMLWIILPSSKVMAQVCNRQQDSIALVQMYNDLNGPNWPFAWNLSLPMDNWWGVTLNEDGCVLKININSNVIGQLPDIQLPHLESLSLLHLQPVATQSLLPDFSGMQHLKELKLVMNLNGSITDFTYLSELKTLSLTSVSSPGLTGNIPDFQHLSSLEVLEIGKNTISVVPDFSALTTLLY